MKAPEFKGAPGHWSAKDREIFCGNNLLAVATNSLFEHSNISDSECLANAKLIAAAPELFEALKYAYELLKDQAERGLYPELALTENGGLGFYPITKALEKATTL